MDRLAEAGPLVRRKFGPRALYLFLKFAADGSVASRSAHETSLLSEPRRLNLSPWMYHSCTCDAPGLRCAAHIVSREWMEKGLTGSVSSLGLARLELARELGILRQSVYGASAMDQRDSLPWQSLGYVTRIAWGIVRRTERTGKRDETKSKMQ